MTTIERYKACVARSASKQFSITIQEAQMIMHNSGIEDLIDNSPFMSSHFAPDEWNENIEAYLRRQQGACKR